MKASFKNKLIVLVLLGVFYSYSSNAQNENSVVQDSTVAEGKLFVDFADAFEFIIDGEDEYQKLLGEVSLRQDSVFLSCDSAIIKNEVHVTAMGNVIIQQGDSLTIFADSLLYNSDSLIADLYGEVVLLNANQKLFTDSLKYNLGTKIASYSGGATLTNDSTQLISNQGFYLVDEQKAFFKEKVNVIDDEFSLKTDTLEFDVTLDRVIFLAPTRITVEDGSKIYCESGFYDIANSKAEFSKNAQYEKEERKAFADTILYNAKVESYDLIGNAYFKDEKQEVQADKIRYDKLQDVFTTKGRSMIKDSTQVLFADQINYDKTKSIGVAVGNVVWKDTIQDVTILADTLDYDQTKEYLKSRGGRPLLITVLDGDSLYMRSDTLIAFKVDTGSTEGNQVVLAYNNVRIFKKNLQAVSDSLVYSSMDSIFYFYGSPIIWSDTSQFMADSIEVKLASEQIDEIRLTNEAFIINSEDEIFFNQIKGKYIKASFDSSELRQMHVIGNAESVYYALDESKAYIGVNKTICSEMLLHFGNNKVDEIRFFAQPKAKLSPMNTVNHNEIRLKGFHWVRDLRPTSKNDL